MGRFGLFPFLYILVGVLVAASVIGDERNYFSNLDNLEQIVEMLLAILLWPLVLLGVSLEIGGDAGGGADSGGSSNGGESGGGK